MTTQHSADTGSRFTPIRRVAACMVLIASASLIFTVVHAHAAPVTFWFRGTIDWINNPSNSVPSGIRIGTPFSGRVIYDPAKTSWTSSSSFPSGDTVNTYYTDITGFSILAQVGSHIITNAPNPENYPCGYVGVYDNFSNNDSLTIETGSSDIIVNGSSTLIGKQTPVITLYFQDLTKSVFNSATIPTNPPSLEQFIDTHQFSWMTRLDDGIGTVLFGVGGTIKEISTNALVLLNAQQVAGDAVRLSWPSGVPNCTLQYRTNHSVGTWQNVPNAVSIQGMEHAVTLPRSGSARLFRLVGP